MAEAGSRSHQRTTLHHSAADSAQITIRLSPKRVDLRNLAAPCPLPSDRGTCTLASGLSLQPTSGRLRAIIREHGARRRVHEHTRRALDPVMERPEEVGRRPELEQIVGSIELTIYAVAYRRTRINDKFQEYRIMKRLLIFLVHRSR